MNIMDILLITVFVLFGALVAIEIIAWTRPELPIWWSVLAPVLGFTIFGISIAMGFISGVL